MISKEELIELIQEKESKNYKKYEKIYISNTWYSPNQVKNELDDYIFIEKNKERGWFVYIYRCTIAWAHVCDYWIVYDKDNIIEEIGATIPPKDIKLEEIIVKK